AKDDFMPQRRRSDAYPVEPAIRRMRWGSLKSRSYDHAGDRRRRGILPGATYNTPSHAHMGGPSVIPGAPMYSSLDRREHSLPPYRYYDRSTYEGPSQPPTSARSYGATPRSTYGYGYTAAREYPHRVAEIHSYDQPSGPEIYEGGPTTTRDYRRGGAGGVSDDYGRDTYHWDYANEQRDMREGRDYRYDHPPYEDERYPPPVQQRSALRRDYQRYSE
uniref:Uncharacterized protein n=1 Tax=Panagrolaimus sp. PS1159 TaxID=55785 RepID=A0AC35FFD3_9BILA